MATAAAGTPSWIDLATPDLEAAKNFYGELFGWAARVSPEPEAGGYTMFYQDGGVVAGAGPVQAADQPPVWTTYVAADDADAAAARVESAGGKILLAPFDVLSYGRMAIFADPAGAVFGVWQAGSHHGADVFNTPGTLTWTELATRDPDSSKAFYQRVFGWTPDDDHSGPVTYTTWKLGDHEVAGMMPMESGQWPPDLPPHWMVYFAVADVDDTARRAEDLGGRVVVAPFDIRPGRMAVLSDPQGAVFSITALNQPPTA